MGPLLWLLVPLVVTAVGAVAMLLQRRSIAQQDPHLRRARELAAMAEALRKSEAR